MPLTEKEEIEFLAKLYGFFSRHLHRGTLQNFLSRWANLRNSGECDTVGAFMQASKEHGFRLGKKPINRLDAARSVEAIHSNPERYPGSNIVSDKDYLYEAARIINKPKPAPPKITPKTWANKPNTTVAQDIDWVSNHIAMEEVSLDDTPSHRAHWMLIEANKDPTWFLKTIMPKIMPGRLKLDTDEGSNNEDEREAIENQLDDILGGLKRTSVNVSIGSD